MGWDYVEILLASPLNLTTNAKLQVTLNGAGNCINKYVQFYLAKDENSIAGTADHISSYLQITGTNNTYTIDFASDDLKKTFNFNSVKSIRMYFFNNAGAGIASNLTGTLTISSLLLGDVVTSSINTSAPVLWANDLNSSIKNLNSGNVNIGLSANDDPSLTTNYYKMTVKGKTNLIGDVNVLELWSPNTIANKRHVLAFDNTDNRTIINSASWNYGTSSSTGQDLILQNLGAGNVGIGNFTAADFPSANLHVRGTTYFTGLSSFGNNIQLGGTLFIGASPLSNTPLNTTNAAALSYISGAGTNCSPNYLKLDNNLQVTGRIATKEVFVTPTATWCDYVFEKNYKLMPLSELRTFVNKNKHLPEIPTTAEVEKSGVNLGEINVLYLKKIEELTLYTLQQQEQLEKIQLQQEKLLKIVETQQKVIEQLKKK